LRLYNFTETSDWFYSVTEYCSQGDLFELLDKVEYLKEDIARDYFHQTLLGLKQIHECGIYHLDVSLENLFLTDNNRLVLGDFGCARKWAKGKRANFGNYRPGKWQYMCPEIFEWKPVYGEFADVWSLGICLFIMLTGKTPFQVPHSSDPNFTLIYTEKDYSRVKLSEEVQDLLSKIFCPQDQRISVSDIFKHPWMMSQLSGNVTSLPTTPLSRNFSSEASVLSPKRLPALVTPSPSTSQDGLFFTDLRSFSLTPTTPTTPTSSSATPFTTPSTTPSTTPFTTPATTPKGSPFSRQGSSTISTTSLQKKELNTPKNRRIT